MRFWHDAQQILAVIPQWISAGAALTGLVIAYSASQTWRSTLKSKRGDDLLATTFDLSGEVGAFESAVDRKVLKEKYGEQMDRLFASRRELQKAFMVARRSYALDLSRLAVVRDIVANSLASQQPMHDARGAPEDSAFEAAKNRLVNLRREINSFEEYVQSVVR